MHLDVKRGLCLREEEDAAKRELRVFGGETEAGIRSRDGPTGDQPGDRQELVEPLAVEKKSRAAVPWTEDACSREYSDFLLDVKEAGVRCATPGLANAKERA